MTDALSHQALSGLIGSIAAIALAAGNEAAIGKTGLAIRLAGADGQLFAHVLPLTGTALALGVAGTTAKTHLEHIFLKTGARRQSELMRLWTGTVCPAAATGQGIQ